MSGKGKRIRNPKPSISFTPWSSITHVLKGWETPEVRKIYSQGEGAWWMMMQMIMQNDPTAQMVSIIHEHGYAKEILWLVLDPVGLHSTLRSLTERAVVLDITV